MFGCLTKLAAKRAELVQKFVPRSHVEIFRNKRTRSSPFDPKLTFWCISYHLDAFSTVWLPYKTRCKTYRTSVKVRAWKWLRHFSQRTHPIHPIGPSTNVLVHFVLLACIRDRLVALRNSVQNGPNKCQRSCHKVASEFRNERIRSSPLDPKLMFWWIL